MQAWFLRKCMTLYNDVVRRTHLPREPAIRRLLASTGVDLCLYGPCEMSEEERVDDQCEEAWESEDECEDDPCFPTAQFDDMHFSSAIGTMGY